MLTPEKLLKRIKFELGYPYNMIEIPDNELIEAIRLKCISDFSKWVPNEKEITMDPKNPEIQTNRKDRFYIFDDEGLPIIGIKDIILNNDMSIAFGHSVTGAFSYSEIPNRVLDNQIGRNTLVYSNYQYTYRYIPPNMIEINPIPTDWFRLIYFTEHSPNFTTIPPEFESYFIELAVAASKIYIGSIRKKHQNLQTTFGNIELDAGIYDEGKNDYREVMQKIEELSLPPISIDVG